MVDAGTGETGGERKPDTAFECAAQVGGADAGVSCRILKGDFLLKVFGDVIAGLTDHIVAFQRINLGGIGADTGCEIVDLGFFCIEVCIASALVKQCEGLGGEAKGLNIGGQLFPDEGWVVFPDMTPGVFFGQKAVNDLTGQKHAFAFLEGDRFRIDHDCHLSLRDDDDFAVIMKTGGEGQIGICVIAVHREVPFR